MNSIKKSFSKSFKTNTNMNSILHNQIVLYIFVFMAVIDLIYFASSNDVRSLFTLVIVGFLTSFFSKNMIVIIFISLVFTHILKYGTNVTEGMEETEKSDKVDTATDNSGNVVSNKKTDETMTSKIEPEEINKKAKKTNTNSPDINSLQKDFQDFQSVQEKILSTMQTIDPLLTKAESFIQKFEHYKNMQEAGNTNDD